MPFLGKTPTKLLDANVNIDGGNIDGTTIGATSAASATVTTFTSTGIDDNATSTAITIDASQNVTFASKATVGYSRAAGTGGIVLYDDDQAENRLTLLTGGGTGINAVINQAGGSLNVTDASLNAVATFNDGGNVGIGTASPAKPLHVYSANSGGTTTSLLQNNGGSGTVVELRLAPSLYDNDIGSTARWSAIQAINGGSGNPTSLAFLTNHISADPAERMRIGSSGNVGIGTSSPNALLHVSSSGNGEIEVERVGGALINLQAQSAVGVIGTDSNHDLRFKTNGSVRASITSTGNVGIGTTAPESELHIIASTAPANITLERSGSNAQGNELGSLQFKNADGSNDGPNVVANVLAGVPNSNGSGGYLTFGTHGGSDGGEGSGPNERMRIDSSGNVGIGTTSPNEKLNVSGNIRVTSGFVSFSGSTSTPSEAAALYRPADNTLAISTANTERMRIDASGNVLVGTTSFSAGTVGFRISADGRLTESSTGATTSKVHRAFYNPNGQVGTINTNGTATAYNTSSDQRLKENITDASSASDDIDAIQVRSFDWKADGSHQKYGMVAQELVAVAPEAVSQGGTEEDMWGVDYSKLVPMMIKEIQDLRARVAQLEGA